MICGLFSLAISFALASVTDAGSAPDWQVLSTGMELKFVPVHRVNTPEKAGITILRIDGSSLGAASDRCD
jgi:hypothetical protein